MKKILTMLLFLVVGLQTRADDNSNRLGVAFGLLYENGLDATLSYEHETRYHNAWEYFGNVYLKWAECEECGHICKDSFWHNYNTWTLGIAYKPAVHIGRNNVGRLRIGVLGGSDKSKFVGGGTVGYEHTYQLKGGFQLFWNVRTDVMARGEDLFKTGISVGARINL